MVCDDVYKIIKKEHKTTIIITHNIEEAISFADKVIVLSKRPSIIKKVFDINLTNKSTPINNRKCLEFNDYYEKIWEELKQEEKGENSTSEGLKRIPKHLPALIKADKIQHKAALVGFDWDNIEGVFEKIEEEYKELLDECKQGNIKYIKEELGDLLFSIVNLARFLKIDSEEALNLTNHKFINRFEFMEQRAYELHRKFDNLTLDEMEELWKEAKKNKL